MAGFSITVACRFAEESLRKSIGASVMVNNYHVDSGDIYYGADLIPNEQVQEIAKHPLVTDYNPFVYSMAVASQDVSPIVTELQEEKYQKSQNTWMRVEGTYDLMAVGGFVTDSVFLAEGQAFEKTDKMSAVISNDIALQCNIAVGDRVRLGSFYNADRQPDYKGEDIEVTVTGIFGIKEYLPHTDAAFYNTENVIYVTPDAAMALNGRSNVYSVKYYISDPLMAESFVEDIRGLGFADGKNLEFIIDTTQYRSMQGTISSMSKLAAVMLVTAIVMGAIVLMMLLMISLRDREYEVGILLSVGEEKWKIIAQMIVELLVPVLLAMTAAIFCSGISTALITDLFAQSGAINISPTAGTVALMYLAGFLLTLLSSSVTVWKVTRYQPKKILMAIE